MEGPAVLDAIGLDDDHSVVYRLVLGRPSIDLMVLASESGLPTERVRSIVSELGQLGLLAHRATARDEIVASPPATALRHLLRERERSLAYAHESLVELSDLYRSSAARRDAPDVVDLVLGADAVRQRFAQLQAGAVEQVRAFVLHETLAVTAEENVAEDEALARGVRYRILAERAAVELPGFVEAAREAARFSEEVRVRPSLPTKLVIADDSMALLPMRTRGGDPTVGALLVHPSGLLDLICAVFEELWVSAPALLPSDALPNEADPVDRDLVKLLLLGLTDTTAGRQLGISARTVQRRIADLMQMSGVSTRFQLGAEAVRRGWV